MQTVTEKNYLLPENFKDYLGPVFQTSFKCLHINARSVRRKEAYFDTFFQQLNVPIDAIMISETWSTSDYDVFRIPGYETFFLNRYAGIGGGVSISFKKKWRPEILERFTVSVKEYEILTMCLNNTIFAVCYRPPKGCVAIFLNFLESLISFATSQHLNIVLGGDLNINMLSVDASQMSLDLLLRTHGLLNAIKMPTRVTITSSSLIDLFITNHDPSMITSGVIISDISDHLPIFMCVKNMSKKKRSSTYSFQLISEKHCRHLETR